MVVHPNTRFADAESAWDNWQQTRFEYKKEALLSWQQKLYPLRIELAQVMQYQLTHSEDKVANTHHLVGPTGETNELYTTGRGVTLLIQQSVGVNAQKATIAQCTAALSAGNCVIICSDDIEFLQQLNETYEQSMLPSHLLITLPLDSYDSVLESDVRNVGLIGESDMELTLNRALAMRSGALVSLVSETDLVALPWARDPNLVLRFITERTRTINITAVGGNANLLELGSSAH
ncbi:MAG: 1-pyrroline-5-carboxylate dehydrogenase [Vibrio sp.]